ncbi:MAG: hypothetical protein ABSF82_01030 [Candidatus Bathyarchaeia archaeon]|jgi:hypothetical protein
MHRFSRRGIAPVVAALLIVVVSVAAIILLYIFASGLLASGFSANASGVQLTILPTYLYSKDADVGVAYDRANFTVIVSNNAPEAQVVLVNVTTPRGQVAQSTPLPLRSGESRTLFVSQVLNATSPVGVWSVKVTVGGAEIGKYSFDVKLNRDEADFATRQSLDQRFFRYLLFGTLGVAVFAIMLSMATLLRPRVVWSWEKAKT